MDTEPVATFRPIKNNKRTFSVDSIHSDSPYQKKASSKVSSRGLKGSSQKKVTPPQTSSLKKQQQPVPNNRKPPISSHDSSLENSFANIAGIKSATNSVQSYRSNFEVNAK